MIKFKRIKELSLLENFIFCMIEQEKEFDLTNEKLANFVGYSKPTVQAALNKLKELGMIYKYSFDGHRRVLKAKEVK
jgi:predicted transcriptional regulator